MSVDDLRSELEALKERVLKLEKSRSQSKRNGKSGPKPRTFKESDIKRAIRAVVKKRGIGGTSTARVAIQLNTSLSTFERWLRSNNAPWPELKHAALVEAVKNFPEQTKDAPDV